MIDWLRAFANYVTTKRGLAKSLLDSVDNRHRLFHQMHEMINRAGNALLDRAKSAGAIRADLELTDLTRLASAFAIAGEQSPTVRPSLTACSGQPWMGSGAGMASKTDSRTRARRDAPLLCRSAARPAAAAARGEFPDQNLAAASA